MEDKMKRVMLLFLLAVVLLPQTTFGGLKGDNDSQPLVSGTTQGNVGCVILEKHMPVKGKLRKDYIVLGERHNRLLCRALG